ncbi:MAG: FG-GAP-like repeat-containing protein [Acidobacteriota bacterium]
MKRNLILSAFALVAIASAAIFIDSASASTAVDGSKAAAPTSGSTTLVISQVYGAGGNSGATYNVDYVEIKNVSGSVKDLTGLALQYGAATGQFGGSTGTNIATLPAASIAPGQYYLVALAGGANGSALPVTADVTLSAVNLSGSSGKIALTTTNTWLNCGAAATVCTFPNAAIIDWVAYGAAGNGTAGNGEGGTAVNGGAALTATQGAVRKNGGCTDTDDNNLDFDVVSPPVPRNTLSTATPCVAVVSVKSPLDYNGDGKTDYTVVRNTGGGASGQATWYISTDNGASALTTPWGIASDTFISGDFDGDGKADITVWRAGAPGVAAFYILQSGTNTLRVDQFGQTGDNPTVVGDYTGDGKADPAVYRSGANAGDQSYFYYRASSGIYSGAVVYEPWGLNGDFPAPGDFDGDGKYDFCIQRNAGGGQAIFWQRLNGSNTVSSFIFGTPTDVIVPGDYDGDGKTDIMVVRSNAGAIDWYLRPSTNPASGGALFTTFGASATDYLTQGDYDGDGKTDVAVWRPSATPGQSFFFVRSTASGSVSSVSFGLNGDLPVARFNSH